MVRESKMDKGNDEGFFDTVGDPLGPLPTYLGPLPSYPKNRKEKEVIPLDPRSSGQKRKVGKGPDGPRGIKQPKVSQAKITTFVEIMDTLEALRDTLQETDDDEDDQGEEDNTVAVPLILAKLQKIEQAIERMDALLIWAAEQEGARFYILAAEGSHEEQEASKVRYDEIRTKREEALELLDKYPRTRDRVSSHAGLKPVAELTAFLQSKILDPKELMPVESRPQPQDSE
ncbi:MAG: hypothetical protein L6R41_005965 [Letrouitia leprolyta]|nr:MAG: hypothetical protein L6R41_005965 [Letrouitia leprolyta]